VVEIYPKLPKPATEDVKVVPKELIYPAVPRPWTVEVSEVVLV